MTVMSTISPQRAKTTAASTAGSFAPKSQSAPETALGGEFVFDKNYRNLAQVEPFYESYLARRAELEAAGKHPYNESFCGHIEGLSGPNEDTAIYLLQTLHERNQNERAAEAFMAGGGVEVDTSIEQTHRGVVARRGWYVGGTGWEELGEGRLVVDEHGRTTFIAKGRRNGVLLAGTLYVKPV